MHDPSQCGAVALALGSVLLQPIDRAGVEPEPARRVGLRVLLDEFTLRVLDDRSFDEQRALVDIDVLRSQRAELASTRTRSCGEAKKAPSAGLVSSACAIKRATSAGSGGDTSCRGSRGGDAFTAGLIVMSPP